MPFPSVSDLSLEQILSSLVPEAGPRRSGAVEAAATQLQLTMEETVQQDRQLTQMARKGTAERRCAEGVLDTGDIQSGMFVSGFLPYSFCDAK